MAFYFVTGGVSVSQTHNRELEKVRGLGYTPRNMSSKYELGPLCSRAKSLIVLRKMAFRFFNWHHKW